MPRSELGLRVLVSLIGAPLALAALWWGGWALGIVAAAVSLFATHEFYGIARAGGVRPFGTLGVAASTLIPLLAVAYPAADQIAPLAGGIVLLVALLSLGAAIWLRWPDGDPVLAASVTVTGVVYVGCSMALLPVLRGLPDTQPGGFDGPALHGLGFVLLPLLVTWAGDTAAYFGGRAFGRRKLAPAVSPGKTVEGAIAGLIGAMIAAVVVSVWALDDLSSLSLAPLHAALIGLVVGAAAQVGDLAESVLKRAAGVKDSGRLLPGHGGFLDRIDALLFAVPAAWWLLLLTVVR